ncbi:hypothetical protein EVAR_32361_1 [Eumeta japonica]|uniref:Uncharacterized protein n=1 Tax=Eumeta variegata TaxID=151549 RepID=A0A4C1VM30_EUMVA|nr:hypothetical protein EVAR_32361_1 [Eumeta japonica]
MNAQSAAYQVRLGATLGGFDVPSAEIGHEKKEKRTAKETTKLHCYRLDKKAPANLIWKIVVPKRINVGVRTNDISRFLIKNNSIICGNRNGTISVYNLRNINSQPKLDYYAEDCHNSGKIEVSTVEITEKYHKPCIISASNDSPVVKFWKPQVSVSNYNDNLQYSKSNANEKKRLQSERDISIGECVGIRCLSMDKSENRLALGLNGNIDAPVLEKEPVSDWSHSRGGVCRPGPDPAYPQAYDPHLK